MSILAIPTALDVLRTQLRSAEEAADIALPLRALQLRGLSKLELVVHVERLRAANDASTSDEQFEENCLLALDIIHGMLPNIGLRWDAAQDAASLFPRCVSREDIETALPFALEPSDLLPPRPRPAQDQDRVRSALGRATYGSVTNYELLPSRCDLYRVPKNAFTTRPAALLTLPDRVLLEALAAFVETRLSQVLPDEVVWPRRRSQPPSQVEATNEVFGWGSKYVVKADVSNFYEAIEHSLLAVFLTSHVGVPLQRARAIESLLTAIMGISRGLPQGPQASDVLASAYLLPLDSHFRADARRFVRYADDYFFPAESMGEGRLILQQLEGLLGELGLSLNTPKTQIMRRETYEKGLRRPSPAVVELKERLTELRIDDLHRLEDSEQLSEILEQAGVEEQMMWDLLYHGTVTLDELLPEIREQLGPSLAHTYSVYFREIASLLAAENRAGDLSPLESLARECLAFLTPSDEQLRPDDLRHVQTWFPSLTPLVARYLSSRGEASQQWVSSYLQAHIADPSGVDWVDAWMCHAAGATTFETAGAVISELRRALRTDGTGALTKAEAVRTLAAAGELNETEWRDVFRAASPALRSEMFFAALGELDLFPWLATYLRETTDPALAVIATELEAGSGPAPG